ncbi:HERV-H LTR-associating protein 2 isoform X1 [Lagopus leucura]|uniref:HERV-H LTR-associating protein 2 isoform X1 n=1 Tax=Lagopus leucura TaxID=30410 RepID=UPI001C67FA8D|nr:HERV-H LTR-associating protein 2 isoform X1 [Lagopus leucura]XP_042722749.1 HERV-H LTR-associating protein 2 isoform X1 [Lagopus leucura]
MKGQKIPSLLHLLSICATFGVSREQETVTGLFSKDVILPCPFSPGNDEVIYWKKENKNVHSYYEQKDQLEGQDPDYRNRTHLFHQNIGHGNASLKLSNVALTDEGLYHCYVGTEKAKTEVDVMLQVRVRSIYALDYQKTDTARMLKCYAFHTYLTPNVTWVRGNTYIPETGWEEIRNGVLFSVRSDQNVINTSDTYYCHINLSHENWTAEWRMQDQLSKAEGSSTTISCEYSNNTLRVEDFTVVWKLNKNAAISDLASFNGTPNTSQTRFQIDQKNFSLSISNLNVDDSGDYVCNISAPHYTRLRVTTLQVEHAGNTSTVIVTVIVIITILTISITIYCCYKKRCRRNDRTY